MHFCNFQWKQFLKYNHMIAKGKIKWSNEHKKITGFFIRPNSDIIRSEPCLKLWGFLLEPWVTRGIRVRSTFFFFWFHSVGFNPISHWKWLPNIFLLLRWTDLHVIFSNLDFWEMFQVWSSFQRSLHCLLW